jgi:hypothetical protein
VSDSCKSTIVRPTEIARVQRFARTATGEIIDGGCNEILASQGISLENIIDEISHSPGVRVLWKHWRKRWIEFYFNARLEKEAV